MVNKGIAHEKPGIGVKVEHNNIDKALKKFKKKIKKSGLMVEIFEREFYTKKSERKRIERNKAIARNNHRVKEQKKLDNLYYKD